MCRAKGHNYFDIPTAAVTDLDTSCFLLSFSIKESERPVFLVPAVHTLETPETPVCSALAAPKMFGEIVVPQLSQRCGCTAEKTASLARGAPSTDALINRS